MDTFIYTNHLLVFCCGIICDDCRVGITCCLTQMSITFTAAITGGVIRSLVRFDGQNVIPSYLLRWRVFSLFLGIFSKKKLTKEPFLATACVITSFSVSKILIRNVKPLEILVLMQKTQYFVFEVGCPGATGHFPRGNQTSD